MTFLEKLAGDNASPRKGDFTSTAHGRIFWPLDPRPEEIFLDDIARALSHQCRWGGHIRTFYSVAQHSVLVSQHSTPFAALGLLHDAAEAYIVDVPTPIKRHIQGYAPIEGDLLGVIGQRFGLGANLQLLPPEVHEADARALATEHRDLRTSCSFWTPPARPFFDRIEAWSPERAYSEFLHRAAVLGLR